MALHVPGLMKVRSFEASMHLGGAGVVQLMPAQGSVTQAPPWQPLAQLVSVKVYSSSHHVVSQG